MNYISHLAVCAAEDLSDKTEDTKKEAVKASKVLGTGVEPVRAFLPTGF